MYLRAMDSVMLATIVETVAKEYFYKFSISKQSIHTMELKDFTQNVENHCYALKMKLMGRFDESTTRSDESLPKTMWDWIKFYLRRMLTFIGLVSLANRIKINFSYLITNNYTTWNMCPHDAMASKFAHEQFMLYGSHFKKLNVEAQRAAEEIVNAAMVELDSVRNNPSQRLSGAIIQYKRAIDA